MSSSPSDVFRLGAEFTRREIAPHLQEWEDEGLIPRELHAAAAKQGVLGLGFPEEVGGSGGDVLDTLDLQEGMTSEGASSGHCRVSGPAPTTTRRSAPFAVAVSATRAEARDPGAAVLPLQRAAARIAASRISTM